jgi:hypothetical protein
MASVGFAKILRIKVRINSIVEADSQFFLKKGYTILNI